MNKELRAKHEQIDDEHFEGIQNARLEEFDQAWRDEAFEFRGAFKAVSSITRTLSSRLIAGLMMVEEKKYWKIWGFASFANYLSSVEVPEFSKSTYYKLKQLHEAEGPETFDVLSGRKLISIPTRLLLVENNVDIRVENGDLVIQDRRVPISDGSAVEQVINAVKGVFRDRDAREAKKDKTIEDLRAKDEVGQAEFKELQRNLDAMKEGSPYGRVLSQAIHSLMLLQEQIGYLPESEKAERGQAALDLLWTQIQKVRRSYGSKFNFEDSPPTQLTGGVSDIARQVLADDDDFGDEEEQ